MATAETQRSAPPVFWELVDESLDEVGFFWGRWESALIAADLDAPAVFTWIEERLLGSIDGLVVAGEQGVDRVLVPALGGDDLHRVAAATHALMLGAPGDLQLFSSHFARAAAGKRAAMRRGLELAVRPDSDRLLGQLAQGGTDGSEELRAAAMDAASFAGRFLRTDFAACFSGSAVLQRAAATQLRHAPVAVQLEWIDPALDRLGRAAQPAAVETAWLMGHPAALGACRELAIAQIAPDDDMLLLLAMLGSEADHRQVVDSLARTERRRPGVWALGFAGRKQGAAACIELLAQGLEIKLAAESFAAITGLDLAAEGMVAPEPAEPEEPIAFEDDDLDADLGPQPEDSLPQPDVPAVIRWWSQHQNRFDDQTRYLAGQPVSFPLLQRALEAGPMRRRGPIARELAIRTQDRYRVQTLDFVGRQRPQLAAFHALPRAVFAQPLARALTRAGRGS
jgi:uncharacterized protein (TIGR02270 family)